MQYTKHVATAAVATLSLLSVSTLAFAATGSVSTDATAVTSTGTSASTTSLEVQGAPRLVKKTADSVVLEWDKVPTASAYIVKYSKASVANSKDPNAQYDNETDQVTTTGAVITKLSSTNEKLAPATPYYFSVVAIDKDGKESDTFSDELMVTTEAAGAAASSGATISSATTTNAATGATFAIKDLVVSDDKTLTVSFSSRLSSDPVRVKITKTSDNSDVPVASVVADATNSGAVTVTTLSALSPASSYTLTVLSAKDASGSSIQEGVNGLKEFTTAETLKAGASSSGATSSGTVSTEGATKVATGAKENVIVFAALLLSLGIVYVYRRKLA